MSKNKVIDKNEVQLFRFSPVKKYEPLKILENLGVVSQNILLENEYLTVTEINKEIKEIFQKIQSNTFLRDYKREVFRGLYIPDSYKELYLDKGEILFINKVPDVSRFSINKIRNIDISNLKTSDEKINKIKKERILVKVLRGNRINACLCSENIISTEKLINLVVEEFDNKLVLGIINSRLISFYFNKLIFSDTTETSRVMDDIYLKHIPFQSIQKNFLKALST